MKYRVLFIWAISLWRSALIAIMTHSFSPLSAFIELVTKSVLRPLLFSIYTHAFSDLIRFHSFKYQIPCDI